MKYRLKCENCLHVWYYDDSEQMMAQIHYHFKKDKDHRNYSIEVVVSSE